MSFRLLKKRIFLKTNWTISRNTSSYKDNFFIEKKTPEGQFFYAECPPNIRFNEDPDLIKSEFISGTIKSNCLKTAFSWLEILERSRKQTKALSNILGIEKPKEKVPTSFSIPIMKSHEVDNYLKDNHCHDFQTLKIKIKDEKQIPFVHTVLKSYQGKLIIDANEGFTGLGQCLHFLKALKNENRILLLEQPFPANQKEDYRKLKSTSPYPVFLDENITDQEIAKESHELAHGINVKLSKSSDPLIAVKQLRAARSRGMKTMLGSMIETSLGIRLALELSSLADHCDLDGSLLIKNDPFTLIKREKGMLVSSSENDLYKLKDSIQDFEVISKRT